MPSLWIQREDAADGPDADELTGRAALVEAEYELGPGAGGRPRGCHRARIRPAGHEIGPATAVDQRDELVGRLRDGDVEHGGLTDGAPQRRQAGGQVDRVEAGRRARAQRGVGDPFATRDVEARLGSGVDAQRADGRHHAAVRRGRPVDAADAYERVADRIDPEQRGGGAARDVAA